MSVTIQTNSATHKCWLRWMNQQLPPFDQCNTSTHTCRIIHWNQCLWVWLQVLWYYFRHLFLSHGHSAVLPQLLLHIFCYSPQTKPDHRCIYRVCQKKFIHTL